MKNLVRIVIVSLFASAFTGCMSRPEEAPDVAIVHLNPTQGNNVKGTVIFTQVADGVRIVARLTDLTPGAHGFHIHEKGDCSAPDGTSAGGHFNPLGMAHGAPEAEQRHIGDLGNLTADASGKAYLERVDAQLSLDGINSIIGRSIIVHEKPDDMKTQPTGNAGPRVACGVIEWQQ